MSVKVQGYIQPFLIINHYGQYISKVHENNIIVLLMWDSCGPGKGREK